MNTNTQDRGTGAYRCKYKERYHDKQHLQGAEVSVSTFNPGTMRCCPVMCTTVYSLLNYVTLCMRNILSDIRCDVVRWHTNRCCSGGDPASAQFQLIRDCIIDLHKDWSINKLGLITVTNLSLLIAHSADWISTVAKSTFTQVLH